MKQLIRFAPPLICLFFYSPSKAAEPCRNLFDITDQAVGANYFKFKNHRESLSREQIDSRLSSYTFSGGRSMKQLHIQLSRKHTGMRRAALKELYAAGGLKAIKDEAVYTEIYNKVIKIIKQNKDFNLKAMAAIIMYENNRSDSNLNQLAAMDINIDSLIRHKRREEVFDSSRTRRRDDPKTRAVPDENFKLNIEDPELEPSLRESIEDAAESYNFD